MPRTTRSRRPLLGWTLAALLLGTGLPAAAAPPPPLSELTLQVQATHVAPAGKPTRFAVRLQDGDASDYNVIIRYGDGRDMGSVQYAECVAPLPADALDQTLIFEHKYPRRGSFKITVEATTRTCYTSLTGLGKEAATASAQVKIK